MGFGIISTSILLVEVKKVITYREIDSSCLDEYDKIPMLVNVKSILKLEKIENGFGRILLKKLQPKNK